MNSASLLLWKEPDGPWQAYRRRAVALSWAPHAVRIEMMKKSSKWRRLGIESMVVMNPKRRPGGDAVGREMDKETPMREVSASLTKD